MNKFFKNVSKIFTPVASIMEKDPGKIQSVLYDSMFEHGGGDASKAKRHLIRTYASLENWIFFKFYHQFEVIFLTYRLPICSIFDKHSAIEWKLYLLLVISLIQKKLSTKKIITLYNLFWLHCKVHIQNKYFLLLGFRTHRIFIELLQAVGCDGIIIFKESIANC